MNKNWLPLHNDFYEENENSQPNKGDIIQNSKGNTFKFSDPIRGQWIRLLTVWPYNYSTYRQSMNTKVHEVFFIKVK